MSSSPPASSPQNLMGGFLRVLRLGAIVRGQPAVEKLAGGFWGALSAGPGPVGGQASDVALDV